MPKKSAGILLYRFQHKQLEVMLVHPGGPFWAKKDIGAWSIPKGELEDNEDPLQAAVRETLEETGFAAEGKLIALRPVKQKSGKLIHAWAMEGDFDTTTLRSNLFEMEWPPRSGKKQSYAEVDRAQWFPMTEAAEKIIPGQVPLLAELKNYVEAETKGV